MGKRDKYCSCNNKAIRIDQYDSYACRNCNIWLEEKCPNNKCFYCSQRPETPQDVNWDDPWNT